MAVEEHKKAAKKSIGCNVITVSDTRNKETDKSGKLVMQKLKERTHQLVDYKIVPDESQSIRKAIEEGIINKETDAIILNGGTGISPRDVTIETVKGMIEKELVGFGEIFRMLSYTEDIGSAAILSRAIAGVAGQTVIFSIPGSSGAVKLAMDKLIIPELSHTVFEARK